MKDDEIIRLVSKILPNLDSLELDFRHGELVGEFSDDNELHGIGVKVFRNGDVYRG